MTTPVDTKPAADPWAAKRQTVALGLLIIAALALAIPITCAILYQWSAWPVIIWGGEVVLITLALALWCLLREPSPGLAEGDQMRVLLLIGCGVLGLATVLLGLTLPFTSPYKEVFGGPIKEWRQNPALLAKVGLALFGGLALMFVGLQGARSFEKERPNLRRLIYGYNAVLGTLLIAVIVGILNVLTYVRPERFDFFNRTFDWTSASVTSISPGSRAFLESIAEPVKVYVLLTARDRLSPHVEGLLENCRALNPRITWESLSRDRNRDEVTDLRKKYSFGEAYGLLVLYGAEPNVQYQFIPGDDLYRDVPTNEPEQPPKRVFRGETVLVNALTYLSEGKARPVIYFTQSSEELRLDDTNAEKPDVGLGLMKEAVGKINFELKALTFDPVSPKVPEDAAVVVVAGPRLPIEPRYAQALRDYMAGAGGRKKGKMIVLLDVVAEGKGMAPSGLETLLAEFNVRAGNDRVLSLNTRQPTSFRVYANPRSSNPLAQAYSQDGLVPFRFDNARTIEAAAPPNPGAPAPYTVEPLLVAIQGSGTYFVTEPDLSISPVAYVTDLLKGDSDKLRERLGKQLIPMAVTVSEGGGSMPRIPGHEGLTKDVPRMAVFGDSTWISNYAVARTIEGPDNLNLFANALSWLRERPDIGTKTEDKTLPVYRLNLGDDVYWRMVFLPLALMVLVVLTLGAGVWVIRRR